MPYKDPEKQREYQRQWIANRREDFFSDKWCVECGSIENLELDHINSSTKVSHNIWSWSEERRDVELAKCQVLCHDCHKKKTTENCETGSILTLEDIKIIRQLLIDGSTHTEIANRFGVSRQTITGINTQNYWIHA